MIKSEPKTILRFLAEHYDLLRDLYEMEAKNKVISDSQLKEVLKTHESDIEKQLLEHKLLRRQGDEFKFNSPYLELFEFLLQRFKPLLPEEIEKYGHSIRQLFSKIREDVGEDKNVLLARIDALSNEIRQFTDSIRNSTQSLLDESRELKSNTQQYNYPEKVAKARSLIDNYIAPLNTILDINHSESIFNEVLKISQYSNKRRFYNEWEVCGFTSISSTTYSIMSERI